ncbi:MAG TPA: hypothetical protein VHH90_03140 [Polyangia bacterium]|nr:hypothetical protein [Polyangia bacterium]
MTSRRSPPRRSSGNSLARLALIALLAAALPRARAAEHESAGDLTSTRDGVTVDWSAGTLSASGGAAADLRMPSVDLSRPGAVRRARAAALARLRVALESLPLGNGRKLDAARVERALGRARTADVQYQSNGGAVVRLEISFADWLEDGSPPKVALTAPALHLAAAPSARVGGRDVTVGAATYKVGPAPADAHAAKADHAGRLAVDGDAELAGKLARGVVVIYVGKVLR